MQTSDVDLVDNPSPYIQYSKDMWNFTMLDVSKAGGQVGYVNGRAMTSQVSIQSSHTSSADD
jgi:hypothetical protein